MAELGLVVEKTQEDNGKNGNVVENIIELNAKNYDKIEKISIEVGKQLSDGEKEDANQKTFEEDIFEENQNKELDLIGIEAQEDITLNTNVDAPQCPKIPGAAGLIHEYKPHWKISNHELKRIVVMPEYLAEAMADAVTSKGADPLLGEGEGVIVAPPQEKALCAPPCPILVLIKSRSGGRLGPDLLIHLSDLISPLQVYDLARTVPETLFRFGLGCLDKLSLGGDDIAQATRNNLRIMVAGGDGTIGWVLTCIRCFQETILSSGHKVPPIGIIPLGTGNDLSRSFGWGGHFSFATQHKVKKWLVKAIYATIAPLDSWQVLLKSSPSLPKLHLRLPYCLELQQNSEGLPTASTSPKPNIIYTRVFCNYFSVGMDAQVAFGFHNFRNHMPWIARGRLANQGIKNDVRLFVKRQASIQEWEFIYIPSNIRAIVILNLQSYAGGRNPWGHPRAAVVRLEMSGNQTAAYMQMDGEPWQQPLANPQEPPTILEFTLSTTPSVMLQGWSKVR